ncbi:MAG: hypothetical protein IJB65_02615 [Clostridia bacterium]|nr:hypothetical protein [Clostridia bacterium]
MVRTEGIKLSKKEKQLMRDDLIRPLRVIEYLDFSRIYDNSPVEVLEGYTVTDTETGEVFGIFKIQNTSNKDIKALTVRLYLYEGTSNIATRRIDWVYSAVNKSFGIRKMPDEPKESFWERYGFKDRVVPPYIRQGESFGESVLIRLPYSYCRKLEFEIRQVVYTDGTVEDVKIISGKKYTAFKELDEDLRYAYSKLNIYMRREEAHPIKLIPQTSNRVWLCCCGTKNLIDSKTCASCGRDKEWQLNNLTKQNLDNELDRIKNSYDPNYVHRHRIEVGKQLEIVNEEEQIKKAEAVERALANVAKQEQNRKDGRTAVVLLLILLVVLYAIGTVIVWMVREFSSDEKQDGEASQTVSENAGDADDYGDKPYEKE